MDFDEFQDDETDGSDGLLFEERQDLDWMRVALGLSAAAAGAAVAIRAPSLAVRIVSAVAAGSGANCLLDHFLLPMTTELHSEELHLRFGRKTRFRIPLRKIVRAYARTYDPIREYGGWGIRIGPHGRAFNMRGRDGVQLVLKSGKQVMVGSQRSEELATALQKACGLPGFSDAGSKSDGEPGVAPP